MTGGTLALGCARTALCILLGVMIGWPIGHWRGMRRAAEDAEDARDAAVIAGWGELADTDEPARPAPPWPVVPAGLPGIATLGIPAANPSGKMPPAPPERPHAGPGKHRHPAGPRHAELPAAGRLPVPEPDPWRHLPAAARGIAPAGAGPQSGTMTLPAPVQAPPWDTRPPEPEPEPQTEVLEPTAADCLPPDALTDTAWTRQMAADMDAWIAEHITATDSTLKQITGGAR